MSEWQPMDSAPDDRRILVDFKGAGPIVAYRDKERPDQWVRYLGFGKSASWPSIHEDYATRWTEVPALP
ncbi:hypothetical protein [Caulobacter segnis]